MSDNMTEVRENRELGWDEIIEDTGSSWTLLPEGDYPFTVTKFERGRYEGGEKMTPCNMAILTLEIDGGEKGTATVTHRLYLHTKTEGLNCAFFISIGQMKPGEKLKPRWNEVVGSKGTCKLEIHSFTKKKDGSEGQSNQVKRFLPPEEKAADPAQGGWKAGKF